MKPAETVPEPVSEGHPLYRDERYTPPQAAAYLHICVDRVYRYAAGGQLGHRRDGRRRLRFSQADLDVWRAAHRVEARDRATVRLKHARSNRTAILPPTTSHALFDPSHGRERRPA